MASPPTLTTLIERTVLVVEDDGDVREEFERALERAGYRVLGAGDGAEGLAILRSEPVRPSLILLDWMMPVMDGMAFLGQTASDPRYASIPVVVVSAVARMARIPTLCVAGVIAKPVRLRTLIDTADRICGVRRGDGGHGADAALDRAIGHEVVAGSVTPTPEQARPSRRFGALRAGRARNEGCFFLGW